MLKHDDAEFAEFGRFPDLENRFGLKRSLSYQLIADGKIRSVALKKKGARSGVRLIDLGSVREFLRSQMR